MVENLFAASIENVCIAFLKTLIKAKLKLQKIFYCSNSFSD